MIGFCWLPNVKELASGEVVDLNMKTVDDEGEIVWMLVQCP